MREIKFRAWDTDRHQMSTESFGQKNWGDFLVDFGTDNRDIADSRFIWLQYTGLKDKNGREIYEGDVLVIIDETSQTETDPAEEFAHVLPVEFNHHSWGVQILKNEQGWFDKGWLGFWAIEETYGVDKMSSYLEVIGNIYEEPSLLEEGL